MSQVNQCSGTQFLGIFIWSIALLLYMICVGNFATFYKLVLYLIVCGSEVYILKYFVIDFAKIKMIEHVSEQPYGGILKLIL